MCNCVAGTLEHLVPCLLRAATCNATVHSRWRRWNPVNYSGFLMLVVWLLLLLLLLLLSLLVLALLLVIDDDDVVVEGAVAEKRRGGGGVERVAEGGRSNVLREIASFSPQASPGGSGQGEGPREESALCGPIPSQAPCLRRMWTFEMVPPPAHLHTSRPPQLHSLGGGG